jgi:anti-sigma factor RsiW
MDCRDVRNLADSFLAEELLMETNHEMLRHLETCHSCRRDLAERRSLRDRVRQAFAGAARLDARPEFAATLEAKLRQATLDVSARRRFRSRGWWALAAALLLAATIGLVVDRSRDWMAMGALARAAVGDHRYCALQFRLTEKPISLDEAARRYGVAYRVLERLPPDDIRTASGSAHVLERHACIYKGQRFAHIVFEFRGARVSMLVADAGGSGAPSAGETTIDAPGQIDGLSLVSFRTTGHVVLFTGEIATADLRALADAVALPLRRGLSST